MESKIRELGYIPNKMARALKKERSGIIGSLFIHHSDGLIHQLNESIVSAAIPAGFETLVIESREQGEESAINTFLSLQVDGLIIISDPFVSKESLERLQKLAVPVVAVERGFAVPGVDNVLVDDYAACYDVGRRIAESGHKRVGFIQAAELEGSIEPQLNVEQQRRLGFMDAARQYGLSLAPEYICTQDGYSAEAGYSAAKHLLALREAPTAIFATSDRLAAGVLQYLYEHKLRVPDDISLIGYDNVLSAELSPAINSVSLVFEGVGDAVLSLLTARLDDPESEQAVKTIHTKYIDRGTLRII